jgi:Protein of unknown function (DUF2442)/Domain of unknown function (DUF4160)
MYYDDHGHPHFHARQAGGRAKVRIDEVEIIESSLTFADGLTGEVDVLDRMHGPVFEQAVMPAGFAAVAVDAETGTIVWPGGADLAPDTLYQRVRTGLWPAANAAA